MKTSRKVLLLILLLVQVKVSAAQNRILNVIPPAAPIKQFEKAEWTINLQAPFTNPYDQKVISLDMLLTSPSGKPLVLPCYFEKGDEGSSEWKARFSPQEVGTYSVYFRLNGKNISDESKPEDFEASKGKKPGFLHKNDLYTFKFDDGSLFRGIGENIGWESRSFEDDKWTYDYLLPTLAKNGANFFRTWMCYWNLPLEWKKVSSTKRYTNTEDYFHPGAIKRMDELVQLCDSLDLYFMLTLDWHGHLMEGGGWKNSNYNQANGGPAKTPTEFFTLQASREKYKNKLRYVVARWGYSTNIATWEFFNEIDNAAFTAADSVIIPHDAITQWHDDMSRYLKDIDPYQHLVSTSVSHRDIAGMNAIAYLDFNQKHIYKHTGKIPAIFPSYIQTFGKPYVIGEFGFRWEDADPKYGEEWDYDYKRGLWYGLFSPTPILPMTWWWELFDDRKMTPYFNSVKEINEQMLASGKGSFEPFPVITDKIEAYGMKCGDKYFVYLLNNSTSSLTSDISFGLRGGKIRGAQAFNPISRQYKKISNVKAKDNKLMVQKVTLGPQQEMVLILSSK